MQVGADRIRDKALLDGLAGNGPQETAAAMPDIEEHSAPAGLSHPGLDFAGEAIDQLDLAVIVHMCVDVSGTQMLQEFLARSPLRAGQDLVVHHNRDTRTPPRFDGAIYCRPTRLPKVRRLDADNYVPIADNGFGG